MVVPSRFRGPRLAVRPPAAGEIALRDDRELRVGQCATAVQRGDHDRPAGLAGVLGAATTEVEAVLEQDLAQPARGPGAVGGDRDRVALRDQVGEALGEAAAVTADRAPARCLHHGRVGRLGRGVDRPERADGAEQLVGLGVQPRERLVGVAPPR